MSEQLTWFKSSYSGPEGDACLEMALAWRKSSYSDSEGGNCVEVALDWSKSTYSDAEGSNCVEVAACPATIHIRDSKLPPEAGPRLTIPAPAWSAFLAYAARR
ncbi:DUF397 domain-containing protein [Streptomyces sp. MZ04]|uniref:DUF397 domain-containing protein n=1 Tax=Streptomyces sp. MZ04 TaxID=2559236 RepID=UPI00107EDCCF|nr:DUF397 domain-containing protein [Streptomyces sp. MZ04]TGA97422.1 DUF397 domain-containing protein [Streptomyces sp. MZ04]